jgi:hypothetical protein
MVAYIPRKPISSSKLSAKEIIAELNGQIDELLSDYKDLSYKIMAGNKKKVVKPTDSKTGKSKTKTKNPTPRSGKWMTEGHLFSTKSKLPGLDLHVCTSCSSKNCS